MKDTRRRRGDVILLKDLAPREEVKGGAGKRVFGEPVESGHGSRSGKRKRKEKSKSKP